MTFDFVLDGDCSSILEDMLWEEEKWTNKLKELKQNHLKLQTFPRSELKM